MWDDFWNNLRRDRRRWPRSVDVLVRPFQFRESGTPDRATTSHIASGRYSVEGGYPGVLLGQLAPGMADDGGMDDEELLQRVRQLRAKGASPKEISRALRVSPAKVAPLVRLVAAQNAEPQHQPDAVRCWINPGWHDGLTFPPHPDWPVTASALDGAGGLVTVMVARPDQRTRSRVCVYLVDTFCLGVKNVIGPEVVSNKTLDKLRYTAFAGYDEPGVSAPLELAQHLVFGAVEFARGLGFEPHRDFATVADHLGTWSGPCPIQFGYNGSPFYIQGPYDDVESIAPYPGRQPGQTACPSPSAWVPRTRTPPLSIRSNRGATRLLDESPHAKTAVCTW